MKDYINEVKDILEETAPEAAKILRDSVRTGHNLKKDKAYEAALEILDRLGFSKQTQSTVTINEQPSIATSAIALALTKIANMYDVDPNIKDITPETIQPETPMTEHKSPSVSSETASVEQKETDSVETEPPPIPTEPVEDQIQFQISDEVKQKL